MDQFVLIECNAHRSVIFFLSVISSGLLLSGCFKILKSGNVSFKSNNWSTFIPLWKKKNAGVIVIPKSVFHWAVLLLHTRLKNITLCSFSKLHLHHFNLSSRLLRAQDLFSKNSCITFYNHHIIKLTLHWIKQWQVCRLLLIYQSYPVVSWVPPFGCHFLSHC